MKQNNQVLFYMMIGIPATGKTMFAQKTVETEENTVKFSADVLRHEMFGDEKDFSHEEELYEELHKRIIDSLKNGVNTIYDDRNTNKQKRIEFLKKIPKGVVKIGIQMYMPLDICLEWNEASEHSASEEEFANSVAEFDSFVELSEGFDFVYTVRPNDNMEKEKNGNV